jgi:hypothetical protein
MKAITTIVLNLTALALYGQTLLSGVVRDMKGEPVPGANIFIKDSYDGTSSGPDGRYSFSTEESGKRMLAVTFIGYRPFGKEIELTGKALTVDVELKEEINELEAVVISAGSFTAGEEKRRTILKAVDIATTAGATADIAGALNTLPGTQKVGEEGRLFVRGGDGRETRTFIDGMLVLDAYSPSAPNTPSRGRFLPFMFKGTSFSTGGYSAEYGQALSSALILNSKDKAELNQTDIGVMSVGMDVAHTQVWERASASAKLQYTNIRPYFNLINQEIDWVDAPLSVEGSGAFRHQLGKDGMLKLYGNFNRSDLSYYEHEIPDPSVKHLYDLNNTFGYINGSFIKGLGEEWSLRGGLSYTVQQNDILFDAIPVGEEERGLHGKLVAEHSLSDRVELRFGGEAFLRDVQGHLDHGASPLAGQFDENLTSAFAESEMYAGSRFVTRLGVRTERNSLTGAVSLDPRISVAWKPGKEGQFSLAYGRFRQSAEDKYLIRNASLQQEKAEHFIVNYQWVTNNRTFRVEAYYKRYDDLVKYPDLSAITAEGSGYARGLEFFWRDNKTLRNVDYWVSYSYLDTERDYLDFPYSAVPTFTSSHNFSIVYKHFVQALKSQLGFTYSYASPRPYNNPNEDSFNGSRTPSYQDLSANVSWLAKPWIIVYASCTNLLGRDNIFGYQYSLAPGPGGEYTGRPVRQPAPRFAFLGVFITLSRNKTVNQLPNL